ncbi:MAG: ABC transporter ATP-binding protein [Anaerolineales bacterium]
MTYAVKVEGLGKQYTLGGKSEQRYRTLRDTLSSAFTWPVRMLKGELRQHAEKIWALRDISFELQQGQVLGVIGRNGAGKSTLLKILSRVTDPTTGYVEIRGRVGSLLEVGTGFHPELTGRENIYLNGAVLGMKRREIAAKFDEIVDFSGVAKFIDTPVKHYSSGMYLRLAFSVAAHLEPEILVVDEVLAVGDAEFQRKCLGKMSDVAQAGRTVLFVSHNMSAILRLTEKSIVLEKGELVYSAPTRQAVDYYMASGLSQSGERIWTQDEVPADAAPFKPVAMRVRDPQGKVVETVQSRQPLEIEIEYEVEKPIQGLRVGVYLQTIRGEVLFTSFDTDAPEQYDNYATRQAGRYLSRAAIPANTLNEGQYVLGLNASSFRVRRYFQEERALAFAVDAMGAPGMQWPEPRQGLARPLLDWRIEQVEAVKA